MKVILLIDVQNFFINNFTKDIPREIASYLNKENFDFVIFTKFVYSNNSPFSKIIKSPKLINPSDTDIVIELSSFATKSNTFIKSTFSIFRSKKFLKFLKGKGVDTLYICGFDTDGCVITTAVEAFDRGYNVRVLEDLCASHHGRKYHNDAIKIIEKNRVGLIVNSKLSQT